MAKRFRPGRPRATTIFPLLVFAAAAGAFAQEERPSPGATLAERFKRLDRDGDGALTAEELGRPKVFERLDADGDGRVTLSELRKQTRARPSQKGDGQTQTQGRDAPAVREEAERPEPPRNLILISWDGLDRSVLYELLAKQKLPNLAALIREGSLQEIEVTGHPTVTKPGHAEMLTGLDAATTGVFSNTDYRPIPAGHTILERVQDHLGGRDKLRIFMVTSKVAHVGGRGPGEQRKRRQAAPPGADDTPELETRGEPFYLTKRRLDVFDSDQRSADETGPLCLKYLAQFKEPRFLAFLHFSDPDHAGHKHGIDSREYREAAIACDDWLGKIVGWLNEQGLRDVTPIYVTTDHGFDEHGKSHSNAPHGWLATNDKCVTRGGIIADIAATILWRFGVDLAKLDPAPVGRPLVGPAAEGPAGVAAPAEGKARRPGARRALRAGIHEPEGPKAPASAPGAPETRPADEPVPW